MNNNKGRVWSQIVLGLLLVSFVADLLQSPAKNDMLSWVLIGMALIALGIFIVNKGYLWFQISLGAILVVMLNALLLSPPKNAMLSWVFIGMAFIALGVSIVIAMKTTKPK